MWLLVGDPVSSYFFAQYIAFILGCQMAAPAPTIMSTFQLARRGAREGILLYYKSIVWRFQTSIPLSYHWSELSSHENTLLQGRLGIVVKSPAGT